MAVVIAVVLLLAPSPGAQQPPAPTKPKASQPPAHTPPPTADSLGVSLKSIRKQLKDMPPPQKSSATGMRYDFYVDVLGKRPAIEFFKEFDLSMQSGVRWGGVTHQEILNAITPFPFRNFGGVDLLSIGKKK
jgi:hypothetical protein